MNKKLMKRMLGFILAIAFILPTLTPAYADDWVDPGPLVLGKHLTAYFIPNTHLDTAWQHPFPHIAYNTSNNGIYNQFYQAQQKLLLSGRTDLRFTASATAHYRMLFDYYQSDATIRPNMWEDIKTLVENGQVDVTGGQVVEPDLNIPSGESFARQSLYAQNFTMRHFTHPKTGEPYIMTTGMVPDVFGFAGQLPQVLAKSEIKYFITSKVNWNGQTAGLGGTAIGSTYDNYRTGSRNRDADIMLWRALDGKSVLLSNFLRNDYNTTSINSANTTNNHPSGLFGANWVQTTNFAGDKTRNTGVNRAMFFYGAGDFGQGMQGTNASRSGDSFTFHEAAATADNWNLVNVKTATATEFFEDLEKYEDLRNLSYVDGELYAEFHRGTYTTWARVKKYNRDNEILGQSAETASAIGYFTNSLTTNSQQRIEDGWNKILINQMHDVLPGSSIAYTYWIAFNQHELAKNLFNGVRDNALAALAYRADTNVSGKPVFVYNDLSWNRDGEVTVQLDYGKDSMPASKSLVIYDGETPIFPTNIVRREDRGILNVTFLAKDVPAIGYKVFDARIVDTTNVLPRPDTLVVDAANWTFANDNISFEVNPATGYISSLKTKVDGEWKETLAQGVDTEAAELQVYRDCDTVRPSQNFDLWDINPAEIGKEEPDFKFDGAPAELKVILNTPEKVVIRSVKVWNGYKATQEYSLTADGEQVNVHLVADWYHTKRMLKVSFPIAAVNNDATYDTAYGAVQRPTRRDNIFGQNRFEVPMHKWADVTDNSGTFGVSILNDAKYGNDSWLLTRNGTQFVRNRLTVARTPRPQAWHGGAGTFTPNQPYVVDSTTHEINYAIRPHAGGWETSKTVNAGYELNHTMKAFEAAKTGSNGLGASESFASIDKDNVVMSAFKQKYNNDLNTDLNINPNAVVDRSTLIIRVYEATGRDTGNVTISLPAIVKNVKEVNIIEREQDGLNKVIAKNGNKITFDIGKFEVLTIEAELEPSELAPLTFAQESLDLDYNSSGVTTNQTRNAGGTERENYLEGNRSTAEAGRTFPAEQWPVNNQVDYQGIKFKLGAADDQNFMFGTETANTIPVNTTGNYSKVYIMGVAATPNGTASSRPESHLNYEAIGNFIVNYADGGSTEKDIKFNSWRTNLSGWNRIELVDDMPYVYDTIAHWVGHHHVASGAGTSVANTTEQYEADAYMFLYSIDIDKSKTVESITIPVASDIKIAAITLAAPPDGFGKVYESSDDDDTELYWDMSDLVAGYETGANIDKKNISGPVEPVGQRAFTAVSSSGQTLTGTEGANQLLVNNGSSKWCGTGTNANNAWFVMDAGEQVKVPGYIIRGANDDTSYTSRFLHTWTIAGSNSPSGPWDTIVSAPGAQGTGWNSNYQTRMFLFDSASIPEEGFRYYRLQILRQGNTANGTALGSSNTTMQFSYFGLVTDIGENGNLKAQVNSGQTVEDGVVTLHTLNGPNFITLTGDIASSATAPVAAKSYTTVKRGLRVKVTEDTKLGYMVNPKDEASSYIAVDVKFSDGTRLSGLNAVDQFGIGVNPKDQGEGGKLNIGEWNYVETDLGKVANRKIVSEIIFGFDTEDGTPGQEINGSLDNVVIYTGDGDFEDADVYTALYNANDSLVDLNVWESQRPYPFFTVALKSPIVFDADVADANCYAKRFIWEAGNFIPVTDSVRFDF